MQYAAGFGCSPDRFEVFQRRSTRIIADALLLVRPPSARPDAGDEDDESRDGGCFHGDHKRLKMLGSLQTGVSTAMRIPCATAGAIESPILSLSCHCNSFSIFFFANGADMHAVSSRCRLLLIGANLFFVFSCHPAFAQAGDELQRINRLEKACTDARAAKLRPIQQQKIRECMNANDPALRQSPRSEAECTAEAGDYGWFQHGGIPWMFVDLPECVQAFEERKNYRSR